MWPFERNSVVFVEGYGPGQQRLRELKRRGTQDGARGVDKQESPLPAEREIAGRFRALLSSAAKRAQDGLERGITGGRRRTALPREAQVQSAVTECLAKLHGVALTTRRRSSDLWSAVVAAETHLRQFMHTAGIDGPAKYPESVISHYGTLFLLLLLEAGGNMWFYGSASPDGLGAGVVQAAVISTVIVGAGAMAGTFALRSCFAANRIRRGFGIAGMLCYVPLAFLVCLSAASFRDSLTGAIALHGKLLPMSVILQPPQHLSFAALTVMSFALMASALAVYKGFTADDSVPGHGYLDRGYRRACEAYRSLWGTESEAIERELADASEALTRLVEAAEKDCASREVSLSKAAGADPELRRTAALIADGYEIEISAYRAAVNAAEPAGEPWPAVPPLPVPKLPVDDIGGVEEALVADRAALESLHAAVDAARQSLKDAAEQVQKDIESYRMKLEDSHRPGTPADSPKLRLVGAVSE